VLLGALLSRVVGVWAETPSTDRLLSTTETAAAGAAAVASTSIPSALNECRNRPYVPCLQRGCPSTTDTADCLG
jgi:hypothetical protein